MKSLKDLLLVVPKLYRIGYKCNGGTHTQTDRQIGEKGVPTCQPTATQKVNLSHQKWKAWSEYTAVLACGFDNN